jgi:hypothetical protein
MSFTETAIVWQVQSKIDHAGIDVLRATLIDELMSQTSDDPRAYAISEIAWARARFRSPVRTELSLPHVIEEFERARDWLNASHACAIAAASGVTHESSEGSIEAAPLSEGGDA